MEEENNIEEQKEKNTQMSEIDVGEDIESALEDAPEEVRHEVKKMLSMQMGMSGVISPQMELMKKINSEHVSQFLNVQIHESENHFRERRETKIFLGIILLVILLFVIVLVFILKDNSSLLEKVLFTLGGLVTGLVGGYGFGKSRGDE